jgi:4-amino-4-deoxy-L-arabinose transferase-like glycosyltransferase
MSEPTTPALEGERIRDLFALAAVLAIAAVARFWRLDAGVPHAVGIDEPQIVDRAFRILRTGDWNTHIFNYPTLVIYVDALVYIARFLWGALKGQWSALDGFSVNAMYGAARTVTAIVGVATVWLIYELGARLADRRVGLIAAAQLAVAPMHVRESHYALTDAPMAALTTAAVWLAVRAGRTRTLRAYAWAGAACGLAAAAKYTGGLALVAVAAAWVLEERRADDRWRKAAAAIAAAAIAFLVAAPYTLLDLPHFLDGFADLFSHYPATGAGSDSGWRLYAKHLSMSNAVALPAAVAAMGLLLARRDTRRPWLPPIVFTVVFFYMIGSRSLVFGRYVLPLVPFVCLFAAVALVALIDALMRSAALRDRRIAAVLWTAGVVALTWTPAATAVRWLDQQKRPDTRQLAADWLHDNAPRNARIAVENSGPRYMDRDGFRTVAPELLIEHPPEWYRRNAEYLVISSADFDRYSDYLALGPIVYQISPTPQRWGPPIAIIKVESGNRGIG